MAFGATRTTKTVDKEILKFPAGLDSIESIVLMASGVAELASAVTGQTGVIGYQAGTVLSVIAGDAQNRYKNYEAPGETPVGVLADNIYFHDNTEASDKPADMFFHGCVFDKDKLIGYTGNEAAIEAALPTCRFEEKVGD